MSYGGFDHHHGTHDDESPQQRVLRVVRELDLTSGEFFLGGSAALALRGYRHIGDLDVGVNTEYWFHLLKTRDYEVFTPDADDARRRCDPPYLIANVGGVEVHFFHSWRRRDLDETRYNDFNLVFDHGIELVREMPCLRLELLLRQKVDAVTNDTLDGREPRRKDLVDITTISQHLTGLQVSRTGVL